MPDNQQPWRAASRTISKFPRCRAYLKAMHIKTDDPSQTDYWLAVTLSDGFSEERLAEFGVNFDTMRGPTLLTAFEEILAAKAKPRGKAKKRRSGKPAITVDKITAAVSEADIIAAMTPKGGWKANTLAGWGIAWPPPHGWRRKLVDNFEATRERQQIARDR